MTFMECQLNFLTLLSTITMQHMNAIGIMMQNKCMTKDILLERISMRCEKLFEWKELVWPLNLNFQPSQREKVSPFFCHVQWTNYCFHPVPPTKLPMEDLRKITRHIFTLTAIRKSCGCAKSFPTHWFHTSIHLDLKMISFQLPQTSITSQIIPCGGGGFSKKKMLLNKMWYWFK